MKTEIYLIEPFTNMHVGSGKENSGIVDNMVQRDVLSGYPVINSTSLKGALKEYFKSIEKSDDIIKHIFGKGNEKEDGKEKEEGENTPGKFNFFSANLLSIPARSDKFSYLNASSIDILTDFLNIVALLEGNDKKIMSKNDSDALYKLAEFGCKADADAFCLIPEIDGAIVEFYKIKALYCNSDNYFTGEEIKILQQWLGERFVIVKKDIFKENITGKLPVIARNHLNNGQSTNLWYEEIVPRQTRFYTFISAKEGDWKAPDYNFNINAIQIGANASVGYGFSKIFQPKKMEE
jgi:CRISPR-associated protein Cmr4